MKYVLKADPLFKSTEHEPFEGSTFLISERYELSLTVPSGKTPVVVKFTLQYLTEGYISNTGGGTYRDVDLTPDDSAEDSRVVQKRFNKV